MNAWTMIVGTMAAAAPVVPLRTPRTPRTGRRTAPYAAARDRQREWYIEKVFAVLVAPCTAADIRSKTKMQKAYAHASLAELIAIGVVTRTMGSDGDYYYERI